MKNLLSICLILSGLFLFSACGGEQAADTTAAAETNTTKKRKTSADVDYVDRMVRRIKKNVEISEEQVASIKEIGATYNFKNVDRDEYIRLKRTFKERIYKEVLTEEQLASIEKK